ncbi:MAG: competence protein ComEA [Thermoleophilaceae bacterium]|nr:competence protein ComEA [Thermoleophilaceae bacterium]
MFDPDRRHLIAYLAAAAVLVVIAARFIARDGGSDPVPSIAMAAPATGRPRAAAPKPSIWVDVAGAVRRPGLYSLPWGARVAAAVELAGGVRSGADRAAVNLAAKLVDGQQILVPLRNGPVRGAAPGSVASAPAAGSASAGSASGPISLSSATQDQLEQLDGIGPALAQRILQYRDQHGGFRSIDELQQVAGIGEKRFEALKGSIAP